MTDVAEQPTTTTAARRVRRLLDDSGASLVGRHVLVLCSGGADSVATAWLLAQLPRGAAPARLELLWCDHGLRADTAAELAAARAVADRIDAHVHVRRADADLARDPAGIEAAARTWRYDQAAAVAREFDCDVVCTGHTADDQLEHVLLSLAGVTGSAGSADAMSPIRPLATRIELVRPLLSVTRTEVESVLRAAGLDWANDPTNADPDAHPRNAVRHRVVPELLALHPGAGTALVRAGTRSRDRQRGESALAEALLDAWSTSDRIDVRRLAALPDPARHALLAAWLDRTCPSRDVGTRAITAVDRLALGPARAACSRVDLPGDACVRRDGYDLVITNAPRPERPPT